MRFPPDLIDEMNKVIDEELINTIAKNCLPKPEKDWIDEVKDRFEKKLDEINNSSRI